MENKELDVWTRVIEVYRDRPHMWDKKNKQYFNREKRTQTFEMMFKIFRELETNMGMSQFKKKFENMRTSFTRELKKVNASIEAGSGNEDVHKPSLWYYKLFSFLTFVEGASEPCRRGIDTLDYAEEISQNNESNEPSSSQTINQKRSFNPSETKEDTSSLKNRRMSLQKKKEKIAQKLLTTSTDDWKVIGMSIGVQLKSLSKHQQIIVQKLISDAIYYGKLEKLTEESSITLGDPIAQHHSGYINSPFPDRSQHNRYQFSTDFSSVTPIRSPSPQFDIKSNSPSQ